MSIRIHTRPDNSSINPPITYFDHGYLKAQGHDQLIGYSSDLFGTWIAIVNDQAISIPRSPFGSIFKMKDQTEDFELFIDDIKKDLAKRNIKELVIKHPPLIYERFVDIDRLLNTGFEIIYEDVNQHIRLNYGWEESIHQMQKRKLESLRSEGFEFRKMKDQELETAYRFLSVCRQSQGLQINISWELLKALYDGIPRRYECFGVFREGKISALCITVNVSKDVSYYYLPATSPMFRTHSPMVLLIAGMVDYYRSKGMKYFDLGISSVEGKPQDTLRLFKERMGAEEQKKATLVCRV